MRKKTGSWINCKKCNKLFYVLRCKLETKKYCSMTCRNTDNEFLEKFQEANQISAKLRKGKSSLSTTKFKKGNIPWNKGNKKIIDKKKYMRNYYQKNKNKMLRGCKRYYKEHIEYLRKYTRQWRENHPGYTKKYYKDNKKYFKKYHDKDYYQKNKEKVLKWNNQWRKTEKGKSYKQRNDTKRRTKFKEIFNTLTSQEWLDILKEYDYKCAYCGCEFNEDILSTRDHIIPISKGGHNIKENIVPACQSCNSKKHDKLLESIQNVLK